MNTCVSCTSVVQLTFCRILALFLYLCIKPFETNSGLHYTVALCTWVCISEKQKLYEADVYTESVSVEMFVLSKIRHPPV